MRQNSRQGFTLIEVMIVGAIIAIIVVVAIPSLQESRKSAIEAKAVSLLRTFVTVEEQYRTRFGTYATDADELWNQGFMMDLENSEYLDEYSGTYSATVGEWDLQLDPANPGVSANKYYYADQTGVIRFSLTEPATSTSPPVD